MPDEKGEKIQRNGNFLDMQNEIDKFPIDRNSLAGFPIEALTALGSEPFGLKHRVLLTY